MLELELEVATQLARQAGAIVLEVYGAHFDVELKGKSDPVTEADKRANAFLVAALAERFPGDGIVAEENPEHGDAMHARRCWFVDPLDGTKEFIKRRAEFTVNVALIEDGEPVFGVVLAPALELLYWAVKGGGAWREAKGATAERIYSAAPPAGTPLTVVESLSHPSPELEEYLRTIPVARRVKAGSSLKFCWVAEGRADIYPRLGPTMEWDVAAGDCIYRQSGRDGERPSPLTYNKPDLRNPSFVVGL
jgi:3'(2'), 5'-bisphosphate nucleotidase